ncbi:MAG: hypothetical protein JNL74_15935 [Fibrobacteres bacterium]|nr:hypothetical protein [Fibrobacterota bacterium]
MEGKMETNENKDLFDTDTLNVEVDPAEVEDNRLDVPGDYLAQLKTVGRENGRCISPCFDKKDTGSVVFSGLMEIVEGPKKGKTIWLQQAIHPKTQGVSKEKIQQNMLFCLKYACRVFIALSGDKSINKLSDILRHIVVDDTTQHDLIKVVLMRVVVEANSYGTPELKVSSLKIPPIPPTGNQRT